MVSVMSNNDLDLDPNTKGLDENDVVFDSSNEQLRVWPGDDVNSSGGVTGSDEIGVCKTGGVWKDKKVDVLDGNDDLDNVGVEEVRGSDVDVDVEGIDEKIRTSKQFSDENGGSERLESCVPSGKDTESTSSTSGGKGKIDKLGSRAGRGHLEVEKSSVSQYDSMLSMFDEFASTRRDGSLENPPGYGFEIGDMVWGKVKSHPWWPGHIYSEKFASPSVRRLKRDGYVLVAFFGDSSYGWFDPAELLPFDSSYSDKLRQTSSRTFVKAVEEAVDEANRRRGLGLACRCRNPYNFRTTTVQGYFVVDVNDYEPGTIYSAEQIRKSRESFQPRGMLAFIKQLALSPTRNEHGAIQFMNNKATVLAYRKAVYEEFDDTYAQAFGHQPVRPSRGQTEDVNQPFKVPTRAPLSGPLVIAEALGKGKGKSNKGKDQAKKDQYLLKRRAEPNELKTSIQINPSQSTSLPQPVYVEGALPVAAGDYVLQKRSPLVSTKHKVPEKHEWTETIAGDGVSDLSREVTSDEGRTMDEKSSVMTFSMAGSQVDSSKAKSPASSPLGQDQSQIIHPLEARSSLDKGKDVGLEIEPRFGSDVQFAHIGRNASDSVGDMPFTLEPSVIPIDSKDGNASSTDFKVEGFEQSLSQPAKIEFRGEQAQDVFTAEHPLGTSNAKSHSEGPRVHTDIGAKKAKIRKHPVGELSSGNSIPFEKKKKQKKEQMSSPNMQTRPSAGKGGSSMGNGAGKSAHVAMSSRDSQVDSQKKEDTVSTSSSPDSVATQKMVRPDNVALELPQLLHDLQAIALIPFNNMERNPEIIREVFLRFRSLVYQKSLPADNESNETRESKSPAVAAASDAPAETIRELQPMKPQKSVVRSDDPAKGGRKRGRSDRQEEIVAKKKKKIHDLKIVMAEKPAQKTPVMQRGDGKETRAPTMKSAKPEPVKKAEPPSRAPDPTMLVMKFPPQGTLPSIMELKARFVRFGQLDHSATRVFWKSSTCRVVFRHKADAQSALRFAVASSNLFGNTGVRCYLRDMEVAAPEVESVKVQSEDAPTMGAPQLRDSAVERRSAAPLASQSWQQPGIQLKSILKKSTGEETGGGRGTPRVKFMLGGEESSKRKDQLMIGNKNSNNNASFADGGTSSTTTTHGMDFNSKNFQKVIATTNALPPLLPLPISTVQFPRQPNNLHYSEVAPRNVHNFNVLSEQPMAPSAPNVDIAHQMINLLTRCNDIVTNVTGLLGYVPYHPL